MRICMITSVKFPPVDGIGNFIYYLSKELMKKGHKVTVITRGGPGPTERDVYEGIEIYRVTFIPLYPFHVHIHGLFLRSFLKKNIDNFDIIHYHTPLPPAINTGLPTITTVHTPMKRDNEMVELVDLNSLLMKLQSKISYLIERDIIKISDKLTTVATSVSEELAEYGLNPEDIEIIGNGVDHNLFRPIDEKDGEKYILYTGRLTYRKGLFDLIECAKLVFNKRSDINLIIVGTGPLYSQLNNLIDISDYKQRFIFLGFVEKSKLIQVYQNATIFVVPSHYEGLPTTLLEAMSCGLPVVATSVSGNLDVIRSGENGILVPAKSPGEMASEILNLLNNEDLRNTISSCARKTIEEKFTWQIISKKILQDYVLLINDKSNELTHISNK